MKQVADGVGGGDLGETACGSQSGIAVAGGNVENALPGAEVDSFAEALAVDLQRGADHGVIARGPGSLLAGLDGIIVGFGGCKNARHGHGSFQKSGGQNSPAQSGLYAGCVGSDFTPVMYCGGLA